MRTAKLAILLVVATAAGIVVPATPASAGVSADVYTDALQVHGDARANDITVTCVGGRIKVNGRDPRTGPARCDAIEQAFITAGPGDDHVDLTRLDPQLGFGGFAQAWIAAGKGDDVVDGSVVADLIAGGAGNDVLRGGPSADSFRPGPGNAIIDGGGDIHDWMRLRAAGSWVVSDERLVRRAGDRRVVRLEGVEQVDLHGGPGADRVDARRTTSYRVQMFGGRGADELLGGRIGDALLGGAGDDRMVGGRGDDGFSGGDGRDVLIGGRGPDLLDGGAAIDDCRGGPGKDELEHCE
jgi:Ca2+-binding RTX toxin-like protein